MTQDHQGDHTLFFVPVPVGDDHDEVIDRMQDLLDEWIAYRSSYASTLAEVGEIAEDAAAIRAHRPLEVDVLTEVHADGVSREVGFYSSEGHYIGLAPPVLACNAHHGLVPWPCAAIRALVSRITG